VYSSKKRILFVGFITFACSYEECLYYFFKILSSFFFLYYNQELVSTIIELSRIPEVLFIGVAWGFISKIRYLSHRTSI